MGSVFMKLIHMGVVLALLAIVPGYAFDQSGACGQMISVRETGAQGDGATDDTEAFIKALERSKTSRIPVYVPRGKYKISKTIVIAKTTLTGPANGAWPADVDALPSIIPSHRNAPAFRLLEGGSICGLDIVYYWDAEPTTGPAALVLSGIGALVRDMRIRYAWDGIMADGKNNIGRTNLENIFMVSIKNVGVRMTGTWDVPRLNNIEVWNAGAQDANRGLTHGIGFLLGKNDLIRLTDCFVFGMHYGFLLESKIEGCEIQGDTWGVMNGCATDFCGVGIELRGNHTLSVSGGSFWDHSSSLVVDKGKSRVRISGCELISNGSPTILIKECDHAVITGCSLLRPMETFTHPAVLLQGGNTVLGSNHIESFGSCIQIEEGVLSAVIQGNTLNSHGRKPVRDTSGGKSKILIKNNEVLKF